MTTMTIRLADDMAQRLKQLAKRRGLSVNKLIEELSAHALAAWDTENHFRALAATGNVESALAILDRLDKAENPDQEKDTRLAYKTGVSLPPISQR